MLIAVLTLARGWKPHYMDRWHFQVKLCESTCTPGAVDAVMMPAELVRLHWDHADEVLARQHHLLCEDLK